jgi:hypothetical protein
MHHVPIKPTPIPLKPSQISSKFSSKGKDDGIGIGGIEEEEEEDLGLAMTAAPLVKGVRPPSAARTPHTPTPPTKGRKLPKVSTFRYVTCNMYHNNRHNYTPYTD